MYCDTISFKKIDYVYWFSLVELRIIDVSINE